MNHRIVIRRQNSHQNIRPADHKRLITSTVKNENHNMTVLELTQKSKDISKYDIYVNKADNQLYLIRKGGGAIKSTGYYIT